MLPWTQQKLEELGVTEPNVFQDTDGIDYEAVSDSNPDIILAPITSQITNTPDEIILRDWEKAGLLKPSSVKPLVSSFEVNLVRRKLGKLSSSDLDQTRTIFRRIFELK